MLSGPTAYLSHLLLWGVPVLALQLGVLAWWNRGRLLRLARAILPPAVFGSLWLVAADHLAISDGIWRFGDGLTLGVRVGAVPLEEVLFFVLTGLLVAFGLALLATAPRRTAASSHRD